MATEPINIPIQTEYDDEGAQDAMQDVEKLEGLEPVVKVDADITEAKDDIEQVGGIAQDLIDRNPWIAEVLADTSAAKADLEKVQTDLHNTGNAAEGAGGQIGGMRNEADQSKSVLANMVGNSAQDIGELGGVAGTAGMAIGQLGEYATEGNISLSGLAKVAGPMAGLTAVTMALTQGQKQAAKAAKQLAEEMDNLSSATDEQVVASMTDMFVKQFEAGKSLATVWDDLAKANIEGARRMLDVMHQQGLNEEQTKGLTDAIAKQDAATAQAKTTHEKYGEAVDASTVKLDEAAAATERARQKAEDYNAALDTLKGGLNLDRTMEDFTEDINTAMNNVALGVAPTKEEIRSIEDTIIEVGEMAGKTPIEIQNELDKVSNGDLFTVLNDAQAWADQHKLQLRVEVTAAAVLDAVRRGIAAAGPITVPVKPTGFGATSIGAQTVNVNLPVGARTSDISRAMSTVTRRSGRRYAAPKVVMAYARR